MSKLIELIILSGPSGVGKTTIIKNLLQDKDLNLKKVNYDLNQASPEAEKILEEQNNSYQQSSGGKKSSLTVNESEFESIFSN